MEVFYSRLRCFHKLAFGKHLLTTNIVTSGLLMGFGDTVEQIIEIKRGVHPSEKFDWKRVMNMTIVGLLVGPPQHYFYTYMDKKLPGNHKSTVFKKIALDQFVASPAALVIFFYSLGIIEDGSIRAGHEEFKRKFLTVYMMDWLFWPPAQFINFFYLSPKYRVLYINGLTMLYDVFLSYIKFLHESKPKIDQLEALQAKKL